MLDQAAVYAEDWPVLLDMLAEARESKQLHEYLTLLVPRLKRMQRQFNRVEYDVPERIWSIYNYNYKMYCYMKKKYGEEIVVTPSRISIASEVLTSQDLEILKKQL